jgi:hypothetical protein
MPAYQIALRTKSLPCGSRGITYWVFNDGCDATCCRGTSGGGKVLPSSISRFFEVNVWVNKARQNEVASHVFLEISIKAVAEFNADLYYSLAFYQNVSLGHTVLISDSTSPQN